MTRSLLAGLLLFLATTNASEPDPVTAARPQGWKLVFADEFSGSELDETKWSREMEFPGIQGPNFHNIHYASYSLDKNSTQAEGVLRLSTEREVVSGTAPQGLFAYSQSLVAAKFDFSYGYVEIRARYPKGNGMWPCIWLMPRRPVWPPEVDIGEYFGGQRKMHHGLAHGSDVDVQWDSDGDSHTNFHDWHVFSFYWVKDTCAWFVDGQLKKVIYAKYVPHTPLYLIMSNSVGAATSAAGEPDDQTQFPNHLEIDYVRIYQPPLRSTDHLHDPD